jgi:hypothetical protein
VVLTNSFTGPKMDNRLKAEQLASEMNSGQPRPLSSAGIQMVSTQVESTELMSMQLLVLQIASYYLLLLTTEKLTCSGIPVEWDLGLGFLLGILSMLLGLSLILDRRTFTQLVVKIRQLFIGKYADLDFSSFISIL